MPKHRGSAQGRMVNKNSHRAIGHMLLYTDYFTGNTANVPHEFSRHFRMSSEMFKGLVHGFWEGDEFFKLKRDCTILLGFSILCLSYGVLTDSLNVYLCMSDFTIVKTTNSSCRSVVKLFGEIYLRSPNAPNTAHLLTQAKQEVFRGCLEVSIVLGF